MTSIWGQFDKRYLRLSTIKISLKIICLKLDSNLRPEANELSPWTATVDAAGLLSCGPLLNIGKRFTVTSASADSFYSSMTRWWLTTLSVRKSINPQRNIDVYSSDNIIRTTIKLSLQSDTQLTTYQYFFKRWFIPVHATIHYLNKWWPSSQGRIGPTAVIKRGHSDTRLNWL